MPPLVGSDSKYLGIRLCCSSELDTVELIQVYIRARLCWVKTDEKQIPQSKQITDIRSFKENILCHVKYEN